MNQNDLQFFKAACDSAQWRKAQPEPPPYEPARFYAAIIKLIAAQIWLRK